MAAALAVVRVIVSDDAANVFPVPARVMLSALVVLEMVLLLPVIVSLNPAPTVIVLELDDRAWPVFSIWIVLPEPLMISLADAVFSLTVFPVAVSVWPAAFILTVSPLPVTVVAVLALVRVIVSDDAVILLPVPDIEIVSALPVLVITLLSPEIVSLRPVPTEIVLDVEVSACPPFSI